MQFITIIRRLYGALKLESVAASNRLNRMAGTQASDHIKQKGKVRWTFTNNLRGSDKKPIMHCSDFLIMLLVANPSPCFAAILSRLKGGMVRSLWTWRFCFASSHFWLLSAAIVDKGLAPNPLTWPVMAVNLNNQSPSLCVLWCECTMISDLMGFSIQCNVARNKWSIIRLMQKEDSLHFMETQIPVWLQANFLFPNLGPNNSCQKNCGYID